MLQRLESSGASADVQETTFSIDVLGRYICSTWDEAVSNGGRPFDAIVLGAGMFGAYAAEKIYRAGEAAGLRVLVLEAGPFLVSEHVQNLARIGLNPAGPVSVDPGVPRERVWGLPWRSNQPFTGLAYCIGGRSIYWGGWAPELTDADLAQWPADVAKLLRAEYGRTAQEIGSSQTADYIRGALYDELSAKFGATAPTIATVGDKKNVQPAPLAVQGNSPASGLFSFDKYSSAPILADAVREDAQKHVGDDARRRIFVVPRVHVTKLSTDGALVTGLEAFVNGQRRTLVVDANTAVVLATGTIESTRLALESFPTPLMGRNLVAHLRTNLVVRVKRSAFDNVPKDVAAEAAALLVRGSTPQRRYHLQVTASVTNGANSEDTMWRMVPDVDMADHMAKLSQDADFVVLTFRGIGEMVGQRDGTAPDKNWVDLSPYERDEFAYRRAWVNLNRNADDDEVEAVMHSAALAFVKTISRDDPTNVQYLIDGQWSPVAPPAPKVRDGLGTTHHEAGTLWMGTDPKTSVTDLDGRFHHVANAYAVGPAVFPTLGSANPSLTALTLARSTAKAIVAQTTATSIEPGFRVLFDNALDGWRMAGRGGFFLHGDLVETGGGPGILWYEAEEFGDFVLRLDYRTAHETDNSGVFLRFPALGSLDPDNDWRAAVTRGFEAQIDDRGVNADRGTMGDKLRKTGAIYKLAAATKDAFHPPGAWNSFEIEAKADTLTVKLNGQTVSTLKGDHGRPRRGHIGLQAHHDGSRVSFRNIRIRPL